MPKKKIKDMTLAQLKAYRKRKKKQKEKEARAEERKTKKRAAAAKKAVTTRKRNKAIEAREETKKVKARKQKAKKTAATRKKNIAIAKKEAREKKKFALEKQRGERRKNKIVVSRSKPIKDMTSEEYLVYKQEYSRIYNSRKKKALEQQQNKDIMRKLSGKALDTWSGITGMKMEKFGNKFSERTENARYLMHPRLKNKSATFQPEGLNVFCEITATVNIRAVDKKKSVSVSLNMFVLPAGMSSSHLSLIDFWIKDVSNLLPEITDKNFYELLQPITRDKIYKMMEWSTLDFIKIFIDCSQRYKISTAEILWQCLDVDYAKKHNITFDTLRAMIKTRKKNVNNI